MISIAWIITRDIPEPANANRDIEVDIISGAIIIPPMKAPSTIGKTLSIDEMCDWVCVTMR